MPSKATAHRRALHERETAQPRCRRHVQASAHARPSLDDHGLFDERGAAPAVSLIDVGQASPARRSPTRTVDRVGVGIERPAGPTDS